MREAAVAAINDPNVRPWVYRMVRVGYAAKGIIYALIGVLAFRLAFGLGGGRATDASGILRTMVRQPFGMVLLTVVGVGILVYAAWYVLEAVTNSRRKSSDWRGKFDRALTVVKAVVYGSIGWEALRIVFGARAASSDASDYARETMAFPLGGVFLTLVGLGIAIYGGMEIWKAWKARFDDDFDAARAGREAPWVLSLGRAGVGARGVILILMGYSLMRAGIERRSAEAHGYEESLWTLFAQPSGSWILGAVAAGLVCFGIFQLLHAKYARLAPPRFAA